MGASQSSQPPSRHNSRHGGGVVLPDNTKGVPQHKQKAASISVAAPMKPPPLPIIIDNPAPKTPPTEVLSVPVPAVAMPIPAKKKPMSLPASGEKSYLD